MIFIALALGLIMGSFLNAVVWRVSVHRSVAKGRSECPDCHHVLGVPDLVPVLSFLWLRGTCRHCRKKISWQYPLVEIMTALAFGYLFWRFGVSATWVWAAVVTAFLVCIFVLDFRYSIIPDSLSLPLIAIGALSVFVFSLPWQDMLLGVGLGGGFFLAQWVLSRGKWIGDGDIRLGAAMGAVLGWKLLLVALLLAYITGAGAGVILLLGKKKRLDSRLPFGTFLSLATWVTLVWGGDILLWYLGLFHI